MLRIVGSGVKGIWVFFVQFLQLFDRLETISKLNKNIVNGNKFLYELMNFNTWWSVNMRVQIIKWICGVSMFIREDGKQEKKRTYINKNIKIDDFKRLFLYMNVIKTAEFH